LWKNYTKYVDTLKLSAIILPVYSRAVRNCPWDVNLWISYLRNAEKYTCTVTEITSIFEHGLAAGFSQVNDYYSLYQSYLNYLIRLYKTNPTSDISKILHETYERASLFLDQYFPGQGLGDSFVRQRAIITLKIEKNLEKFREIWEDLLKRNGSSSSTWITYIEIEQKYGDKNVIRQLFKRALHILTTEVPILAEVWLQYEREEGILEHEEIASEKIQNRLLELNLQQTQTTEPRAERQRSKETPKGKTKEKSKKGKEKEKSEKFNKRKVREEVNDETLKETKSKKTKSRKRETGCYNG